MYSLFFKLEYYIDGSCLAVSLQTDFWCHRKDFCFNDNVLFWHTLFRLLEEYFFRKMGNGKFYGIQVLTDNRTSKEMDV